MLTNKITACIVASLAIFSLNSNASDKLSLNGFGTIGVTNMAGEEKSFGLNGNIENGVSFKEDTRIGGQASYQYNDKLSFTAQARVKNSADEWIGDVTWAYVDYAIRPDISLKAGRMAMPTFLASDSLDIGYSQTMIRQPVELYELTRANNFEGLSITKGYELSDSTIDIQLFGGIITEKDIILATQPGKMEADSILGFNLGATTDYGFFRVGHVEAEFDFSLNSKSFMLGQGDKLELNDAEGSFSSIGYVGEFDSLTITSEIGRVVSKSSTTRSETISGYLMGSYNMGLFTPYTSISHASYKTSDGTQTSIVAGLRWDFKENMSLKVEAQKTKTDGYYGTFQVNNIAEYTGTTELFGMPPVADANANVISASVDFIF